MNGMTREEGINQVFNGGGHVVILGAGASIASTSKNPEKNGKLLPSMDNLIEIVGLDDLIKDLPNDQKDKNFETLYGKLHKDEKYSELIVAIEERVRNYFLDMSLPEEPTIYDYLVLSLRSKDLIATFNWDPFLFQAWSRNREFTDDLPYLSFLHGNVSIGYSKEDKRCGPAGMYARKDGGYLEPTKLLYPIEKKDYNSDEFIKMEWDRVRYWLSPDSGAVRATIFGYGAPASDVEAVELLNTAWGMPEERVMEQFEIIGISPEKHLRDRWKGFIHSHHYDIVNNYFSSSLAQNPRRTNESYFSHYQAWSPSEAFRNNNPIPSDFNTMEELWEWHQDLIQAEQKKTVKSKNDSINKRSKTKRRTNAQIVEYWKNKKRKKRTRIPRKKK